jgi:hypothetical protein
VLRLSGAALDVVCGWEFSSDAVRALGVALGVARPSLSESTSGLTVDPADSDSVSEESGPASNWLSFQTYKQPHMNPNLNPRPP